MLILGEHAHHNAQRMSSQAFLQDLGRRLRAVRTDAGLTLTEVAQRAGLSRRFLTDAEAGRANPSFLTLVQLSQALGQPMRELCDLPVTRARGERVALVGLRGAGKSTVGRALALALEVPFVELDERIEALAGLGLAEIFDVQGSEAYRRYEAEALEAVLAEGERLVIATGGSIVTSPETFARLRRTCRTVWLQAEPAEHFQRVLDQGDRRPMKGHPRAMAELQALLDEREPLYAQCELSVRTTERTPDDVVAELAEELAERA